MLISELIASLEKIMADRGDVEVLHKDDAQELPVDRVYFETFSDDSTSVVISTAPYAPRPRAT